MVGDMEEMCLGHRRHQLIHSADEGYLCELHTKMCVLTLITQISIQLVTMQ
jgi:hypothetical protein